VLSSTSRCYYYRAISQVLSKDILWAARKGCLPQTLNNASSWNHSPFGAGGQYA